MYQLLLDQYERELGHLRRMGGEFASEFPKIAKRLGLDEFECADPYVERLLEGFAFLAARVQLQIAAQFPRFTGHLMETVYPHYLAPVPSMAVVELQPDLAEGSLGEGFVIPRHSELRSQVGQGEQTPCIYRTAHEVTLWPVEITEVEYFDRDHPTIRLPEMPAMRAGFRIRLRCTAGLTFDQLSLDRLPIYLRRFDESSIRLYEQLFAHAGALVVRPPERDAPWLNILKPQSVCRVGFEDEQSLFPYDARSFQGYRLLHEYFVLPQRFMFVEFADLAPSLKECTGDEIELVVLFDRSDSSLMGKFDASDFSLFCTPAINIFRRRADRIHLSDREHEYHVVPDRNRPMDFEVYRVSRLTGFGTSAEDEQEFTPFYCLHDTTVSREKAYFTTRREPRLKSARRHAGSRADHYAGSEVFVSLSNQRGQAPAHGLRQLGPETLCTNRDLPLLMPVGLGDSDFTLDIGAPVRSIRCVAGLTKPRPSPVHAEGEAAWQLMSHLSLNYLTLCDNEQSQGAAALRELLALYADKQDPADQRQIEGVRAIRTQLKTQRLPGPGPIVFGRALEIMVDFDESAFQGTGIFLLGAVFEKFFAKYVSINSMTETVINSTTRGEVVRWPVRMGRRHTL